MADQNSSSAPTGSAVQLIFYWTVVGVPLVWGVYKTLIQLPALFK